MNYPKVLTNLMEQLKYLPGVGPKSAERMAFYILKSDSSYASGLANALTELKNKIRYCAECFNLSETELCGICGNSSRMKKTICVVETPKDLDAIEKTRRYNGVYHVLLGKISPLDGVGPEHLKLRELLEKVEKNMPEEVIIATSSDVEGEATALYISKVLKPLSIKVTRIAYGIPVGSTLEFADEMTLSRSMEGRQVFA